MSAVLETEKGKITYADDYIATIAGVAATECYGVVGMSAKKMFDGITELLGMDNLKKGVKVTSDSSQEIKINLYIVVQYGVNINAVSSSIIETVRYHVEKDTCLHVREVNVIVSGINIK